MTTGRYTAKRRGVGVIVGVGVRVAVNVGPVGVAGAMVDVAVGGTGNNVSVSVGAGSLVLKAATVGVCGSWVVRAACKRKLTPTRVAQKATNISRISVSARMQLASTADVLRRGPALGASGSTSPGTMSGASSGTSVGALSGTLPSPALCGAKASLEGGSSPFDGTGFPLGGKCGPVRPGRLPGIGARSSFPAEPAGAAAELAAKQATNQGSHAGDGAGGQG